jgi:A/G-specific adenine glycosylase
VAPRKARPKEARVRIRAEDKRFFQEAVIRYYGEHGRKFPWRETRDPYRTLVTEVLLRQTAAWKVERIYSSFFRQFRGPSSLARASNSELSGALRPLGLQNQRGIQLGRLGRTLLSRHRGRVPRRIEELLSLPGIGKYGAHATACFAFGEPYAIIDTNVNRILRRYHEIDPSKVGGHRIVEGLATNLLPTVKTDQYNWGLLDLGAAVCVASKPRCGACPLSSNCAYSTRTIGVPNRSRGTDGPRASPSAHLTLGH